MQYLKEILLQYLKESPMQYLQEFLLQYLKESPMQYLQESPLQYLQESLMLYLQESLEPNLKQHLFYFLAYLFLLPFSQIQFIYQPNSYPKFLELFSKFIPHFKWLHHLLFFWMLPALLISLNFIPNNNFKGLLNLHLPQFYHLLVIPLLFSTLLFFPLRTLSLLYFTPQQLSRLYPLLILTHLSQEPQNFHHLNSNSHHIPSIPQVQFHL